MILKQQESSPRHDEDFMLRIKWHSQLAGAIVSAAQRAPAFSPSSDSPSGKLPLFRAPSYIGKANTAAARKTHPSCYRSQKIEGAGGTPSPLGQGSRNTARLSYIGCFCSRRHGVLPDALFQGRRDFCQRNITAARNPRRHACRAGRQNPPAARRPHRHSRRFCRQSPFSFRAPAAFSA